MDMEVVMLGSSEMIAIVESVAKRTKSEASLAELRTLWAALKNVEARKVVSK